MKPETRIEISPLTRREFVRVAVLAASGAALGLEAASQSVPPAPRPIIGFSKPFRSMGAEDSAALVEEVGWSGIECPVRSQEGQIQPEQVDDVLPRFVDAFRRRGLDIPLLVTEISSIREPHAEAVLRAAAKLGIKRIRLGTWTYVPDRPLAQQLDGFGSALRDIGEACGELGIQGAVQNHSAPDRFGAPVWDVVSVLGDKKIKNVSMCFDIGHATVEGGLSWPIQARLAEPYYCAVYVKDFTWGKGPEGWRPDWCPLGQGMIHRSFIAGLGRSGYSGPICQHQEYRLGGRAEMVASMRSDLRVLREWLAPSPT
jgi:sugar phosphate isomerase/epimerase